MTENYINPNNIIALKESLTEFDKNKNVKSLLFFMADSDQYSSSQLTPILKSTLKPIIGGIFPELIFNGERKNSGVLIIPLTFELKTQLLDLSLNSVDIFSQLEKQQNQSTDSNSCLFVFIDAFSENKEMLTETLFNYFGINPTYIGGGAGSLNFKQFPCIINNNGIHENAAVIGWGKKQIEIGVAHGWESISNPLKVTEAANNKIISINWKPAFEVYKEIVESHSGMKFNNNNFFDIAKSYPFGISKMDEEKVVRDPFKVTNNTIYFIDNIQEGAYVEVLHGNIASLLKGSEKALENAFLNNAIDNNYSNTFCVDCISRVLYLNNNLQQELDIVSKNSNVSGIFSIGEIANYDSILEIYNKTIVIALW